MAKTKRKPQVSPKGNSKIRGGSKKGSSPSGPVLDLHGKNQDEVFDLVDRFVWDQSKKGLSRIRIMTGKGKGLVRKQVVDYLKKAGYPWQYERLPSGEFNEGVLIVFID
ncbi:MAG: Smr/MutS family protein [Bdellovibrionales bacterium]|nr:Smr/MutS family protein [Bdellovibrionales bacterium]